jgi:hypothetical protein
VWEVWSKHACVVWESQEETSSHSRQYYFYAAVSRRREEIGVGVRVAQSLHSDARKTPITYIVRRTEAVCVRKDTSQEEECQEEEECRLGGSFFGR